MESEGRPLLQTFSSSSRRKRFCSRIPYEVAVTGAILGVFLLVVTLLIVLENLESSSNEQLKIHSELLGSTSKDNKEQLTLTLKNALYKPSNLLSTSESIKEYSSKHKKMSTGDNIEKYRESSKSSSELVKLKEKLNYIKTWVKEWKNNFIKDEYQNAQQTYQEVEEKHPNAPMSMKNENDFKDLLEKPLNISEKSSQDTNMLDSPFKYNKKAFDKTWQDRKGEFDTNHNYFNYYKWEDVDMKWKKHSDVDNSLYKNFASETHLLGSPFKYNKKNVDNLWQNKKDRFVNFKNDLDNYKWDTVNKGWKQISQMEVAAPNGCPFKNVEETFAAPLQSQIDCALVAEEMRRKYGKCIELSFLPRECKPNWRSKCFSNYKYRKIDGSCNNRIHPTWGRSGIPFLRMIAPDYGDGISSLRTSSDGTELPNARYLSRELYSKQMKPDIDVSILFLYFGLIVDHDMVETAIDTGSIPCCDERFREFPRSLPKECLQINVPSDDPFYGPRNVKCLNLVRSVPVQGDCIGRREQLNKATAFLDGSAIYGSTMQRAKALRSFSKGELKTQHINNSPFMTYSDEAGYSCGTPSEPLKCFAAGDSRVNMLVDLTVMHTLWYREHNRIVDQLHNLNPTWTDETLYQEARRIVIAQLQHITYHEFLPLLLGEEVLNEDSDYDDTINPSIFNVFGAAAFRFGHSLVQDVLELVGPSTKSKVLLHQTFFNSQLLHHSGFDLLLRGATTQKIHAVDSYISKEIREHLFQPSNKDFGHDLAAVGIQRGRDHGLPSYRQWRSVCSLSDIKSWDDLDSVMDSERAKKLKQVYQSFEDIDLIPGALAENHVKGSLLGPTYHCLISRQFRKTRKGDRYWYEDQGNINSFTKAQLEELYQSNMARIICDNSDNINQIQKHPFRISSSENPVTRCDSIPGVNLSRWKEISV